MDESAATPDPWSNVMDFLPVGVTINYFPSDDPADGHLVAANAAASRILGFDLSEFIGSSPRDGIDDRFDEDESIAGMKMLFDVAIGGHEQVFDDFVVEHGPGRGHYQSMIFPLPGRRAASVFRNVDHEIAASEALDWAMATLESTNKGLAKFASTVAHDLKNPLAGISGNAELIKMNAELEPDLLEALDRVIELSSDSVSMVEGLLRFAKTPAATASEKVDVRSAINWATNLLVDRIEASEATVTVTGDAVVLANEAAVRQVVLNLVSNSIRYRHKARRPEMAVTIDDVDGLVFVSFEDNGVGIEPAMREQVFEWGMRNDSDSIAPGGTGLGLAASRAALTNLTGAIEIAEPEHDGLVVVITLPAATPPQAP